ncbi:LPS export ABC transporter permease LptG [soil metagenome]
MRTIDRYVAREFLRLFILFAVAAPLLFVLGDWTDNIDSYTERGLPLTNIALGYLYQMPMFVSWSLPVAALIATVFTVNNMTRHSEMTAAKAGGISFFRALAVLPVLGVLLTGLALVLTELVPIGIGRKMDVLGEVEFRDQDNRHDFIYTGRDGHVVTVRALDMAGPSMRSVTIEHPGSATMPAIHVSAQDAAYDSTGNWVLRQGVFRTFENAVEAGDVGTAGGDAGTATGDVRTGAATVERSFGFDRMIMAAFSATPEQLMARPKQPEELRYAEMDELIETLERSGARPLELIVKQAQKIAIPVATLVIVLFGAPLANGTGRGGAAYGIGISLGITIFYMMLFKLTGAMGVSGMMDPLLAAWLPNGLFLLAAGVLLTRVRT